MAVILLLSSSLDDSCLEVDLEGAREKGLSVERARQGSGTLS